MFPKSSRLLLALGLAALTLALASSGAAQVVASDAYQVSYYTQFGVQSNYRIINTGQVGSPIDPATSHGTVCADIYVFDNNQEMLECCSCPITANGLLSGNVFTTLLNSTLTNIVPAPLTGVVKIVADSFPGSGVCNPTQITSPVNGGLRATMSTGQGAAVFTGGGIGIQPGLLTETNFQPASLTQTEQSFLGNACSFVLYLGSGRGRCLCNGTE